MLSLEPELERLRPLLGNTTADALIARERRDVFSVQPELRILAWGGAMALATAGGIVLKNNYDRIGPIAIAALMGVAAAACYAWVWWRRAKASLVDDYVLLLGALLFSADVAFVESQFHLFGDKWYRHFLIVAMVHAAGAYAYRSRVLLTLSIAALAAWLGVSRQWWDGGGTEYAIRAFMCAAVVLLWRFANRVAEFTTVFEHFAANLAFGGSLALMFENRWRTAGCVLAIALSMVVITWGVRTRRESFVLYAFLYGFIAVDVLLVDAVNDSGLGMLIVIVSTIAAIPSLLAIHRRLREVHA